jgi:hypothetical protein
VDVWKTTYQYDTYKILVTIGIEASDGTTGYGGPNKGINNGRPPNNYRFTPIPPIQDDDSRSFNLPSDWNAGTGNFEFYGVGYNTIHVATNGIVTFGSGTSDASNDPIPIPAAPNNYIALFWDDLKIDQIGTWDRINYTIQGPPGYRICIIEYNCVTCKAKPTLELTGQVVLSEMDHSIELRYSTGMASWSGGMTATIGIEDSTGSNGMGGPSTSSSISQAPPNNYKFTPIYPPANWPGGAADIRSRPPRRSRSRSSTSRTGSTATG